MLVFGALADLPPEPAVVVFGATVPVGEKAFSLAPEFAVTVCWAGLSLELVFAEAADNSSANILAFAFLEIAANLANAVL